jgi:hypothetical protein
MRQLAEGRHERLQVRTRFCLAFPNLIDGPTQCLQLRPNRTVAILVASKLLSPKVVTCLRVCCESAAVTVPEATVYKDYQSLSGEYYIWGTW